jgi:hypothetical protein
MTTYVAPAAPPSAASQPLRLSFDPLLAMTARPAVLLVALLSAGCVQTVRAYVGPTVDTGRKVGVTAGLAYGFGFGDHRGPPGHYVQALTNLGGGRDGATGGAMFAATQDFDYLYWASRMGVRAGVHVPLEIVPAPFSRSPRSGFGAHAAVLPMVHANDAVTHVCIGPEVRAEVLSGNPADGGALGLFSLPLVVEVNWLSGGGDLL